MIGYFLGRYRPISCAIFGGKFINHGRIIGFLFLLSWGELKSFLCEFLFFSSTFFCLSSSFFYFYILYYLPLLLFFLHFIFPQINFSGNSIAYKGNFYGIFVRITYLLKIRRYRLILLNYNTNYCYSGTICINYKFMLVSPFISSPPPPNVENS